MINPQYPVARKNGLVVQEVPDEVLIYDLDSNKAHCLNKTAAAVWRQCSGNNSVSDIANLAGAELNSVLSNDIVWLAIDQLSDNRLLENEVRSNFSGQSRREVLKKIGFAAVVGLPIVASLVAPKNVLALASCGCTNASIDCAGTNCPSTTVCNSNGICAPEAFGSTKTKRTL